MWQIILNDLKAILIKIEGEAATAWSFLVSFFKEAITEEEAALFPVFKAQVVKLFNDEAAMQGLSVKDRVALAVTECTADFAQDLVIAKNALFHSWAWAIAHQQGLVDGNQGASSTGDFSGTTPPPAA
jgi:hypothetical protein